MVFVVGGSGRAVRYMRSGLFDLGRDVDAVSVPPQDLAAQVGGAADDGVVLGADEVAGPLAVPVFPFDGDGFVRLQLQLIRCGESLLAVGFSSRELLVERLGEFQPWLNVPSASLLRLVDASAIDGMVIDPAPDLARPVWTREALEALREVNRVRF